MGLWGLRTRAEVPELEGTFVSRSPVVRLEMTKFPYA